jgi:hypothetical protein
MEVPHGSIPVPGRSAPEDVFLRSYAAVDALEKRLFKGLRNCVTPMK